MSVKEGSLGAPIRHPVDWENPNFVDDKLLDDELRRVFDICRDAEGALIYVKVFQNCLT